MRLNRRRGYLLAEALCALALAGVLAATAAVALGNVRRALASSEAIGRQRRTAREGATIAATMLRDADAVAVLGDTAASGAFLIAVGAACHIDASRRVIVLPPHAIAGGTPLTARAQAVEGGDVVALLSTDSLGRSAAWITTVVDSAGSTSASSPCGPLEGWTTGTDATASRLRLTLRDSLPPTVRIGAPVRVMRSGRLGLYHAGSGDWMLGWRRCASDGSCSATQPVAGPFVTPGRGGVRFRLAGRMLIVTARAAPGGVADSAVVTPHALRP